MPLYDYRCTECGLVVEVMHGIDVAGPQECLECGGAMRKALSTPSIHFKGSGWAKKDAASARKAKPAGSPTSDTSKKKGADDSTSGGAKGESGDSGAEATSSSEPKSKPAPTADSTAD